MIGWENVTSRIGHACRLGPELLKGRQLCVCHASTQRWTIREGNPRSSVYDHTCVTPSTCLSFASMLISGLMKKTFCILSLTCTASVYGLAPACFLLSVIQVSFSNSWGYIMEIQPGFGPCSCLCLWIGPRDDGKWWRPIELTEFCWLMPAKHPTCLLISSLCLTWWIVPGPTVNKRCIYVNERERESMHFDVMSG